MSTTDTVEMTRHLTFTLGSDEYALDIGQVREVLDYTAVTKVPRMPEFMRGIINVRGSAVPVVDLRLKLDMSKSEKTVNSYVIISEVAVDGETAIIGLLADSVQEVLDLETEHIEPAPKIGARLNTEFISGMGKREGKFVIILDINKVFSTEDLSVVQTGQAAMERTKA